MTSQERAEKIADEAKKMGIELRGPILFPMITAQIEEAEREAYALGCKEAREHRTESNFQAFERGFSAAREMATHLVTGLDHCDMNGHSCTKDIADRIGTMEPK